VSRGVVISLVVFTCLMSGSAYAQSKPTPAAVKPATQVTPKGTSPAAPVIPAVVNPPADYLIGIQDSLDVVVWREKDMSAEGVEVRPDGKISLPLINDIQAAGLTVEQLRSTISEAAAKFVMEPTVSVVIKKINSRQVAITGQVGKPAQYPLLGRMTVVDLISVAGGVAEYAKTKNIRITRKENGKTVSKTFNYKDFLEGKPKALEQNIELMPGDVVTVP
jgi:polysaccharide export outer membrane protein